MGQAQAVVANAKFELPVLGGAQRNRERAASPARKGVFERVGHRFVDDSRAKSPPNQPGPTGAFEFKANPVVLGRFAGAIGSGDGSLASFKRRGGDPLTHHKVTTLANKTKIYLVLREGVSDIVFVSSEGESFNV